MQNSLYQEMEDKKEKYLKSFTERVGVNTVEKMKKIIEAEEESIREIYAELTIPISSADFVNLILHDSVFIVEFIIRLHHSRGISGDLIVDQPFFSSTVIGDLILLENQLHYFVFDKLFGSNMEAFCIKETLDQLILKLFSLHTKIKTNTNFKHFTDMFRCAYEESLDRTPQLNDFRGPAILTMRNADSLSSVGVEFKVK